MLKRNKKSRILAAVLSAAFCVGGYGVSDAYTYSGVISTVDKVAEDENEFVVTGGSKITSNNVINPQKIKVKSENVANTKNVSTLNFSFSADDDNAHSDISISGLPCDIPTDVAQEIINEFKKIDTYGQVSGDDTYITGSLDEINKKYNLNISWTFEFYQGEGSVEGLFIDFGEAFEQALFKYNGTKWEAINTATFKSGKDVEFTNGTKVITTTEVLGDASITVSNNSTLNGNKNVQTSKAITVTGNSLLSAADTITGGTITTDRNIVANSGNADSGDAVRAKKIISNGLLKSSNGAIAARNGSISAGYIQSAGGVYGDSSITAKGKVKGKSLNVAKVKASSASITGALTFSGNTVLNGGASANRKKVSSVAKGTANMDLINLGQMNTAFAGAGKTYTAAGNIAINSSNNAISVVKNGAVSAGNTGIVSGGTVYKVTSGLDNSLNLQNNRLQNLASSMTDQDTLFTAVNGSVESLKNTVNSSVNALNTNIQGYVRNDFSNITSAGKNSLTSLIKSIYQRYVDNRNGVSSVSTLAMSTSKVTSKTVGNKLMQNSVDNVGSMTGGELYDALDAKADSSYVDSALSEKLSGSDFEFFKSLAYNNTLDITALKEAKADKSSLDTALSTKVNKEDFDTLHSQVMVNGEDIAFLLDSKLDMDGAIMDTSAYSTKLANGILEKSNKGLVTGGMVYDALLWKADTAYVDAIGEGLVQNLQATECSLRKDMNKMAAGAAALAGLHPQDYNEECKLDFAAGYGHYKDANAVAVGLFYRPNAITTVSLSGTVGNGSRMVNAGLSFKIGYGKEIEKTVITKTDYEMLEQKLITLSNMIGSPI